MNLNQNILPRCNYIPLAILIMVLPMVSSFGPRAGSPEIRVVHEATDRFTYTIIPLAGNSYGYEIYDGGKRLIRQSSIPTQPGNRGFANTSDAEKVAALVILKLKRGEWPPRITKQELVDLKIPLS